MQNELTLDKMIVAFDTGLRTLLAKPRSVRPHPDADIAETELSDTEKKLAGALMRVNHTGEVCAQALYNGQALTARNAATASALKQAAIEETEHLAWCENRIQQLGGHASLLNPIFYASSLSLGVAAGILGDRWNLGFLAETERQVGAHLNSHLHQLPATDHKSRAIVEQMRVDEADHAQQAIHHGAAELPAPVKFLMRHASKLMTSSAQHI
jgi:ubiquinone biosynthesis monooxygenase Coq7